MGRSFFQIDFSKNEGGLHKIKKSTKFKNKKEIAFFALF
jgi:hypothetical protein